MVASMGDKGSRSLPQKLTLEHVSPATRLLEKRRQMFEVQEALDAQKEEYKRREAEFKRREEKLKERDLALQESLIKFNKFLQENDSKRARAEKKERDELKQRVAKESEIKRLRETLERLKQDKVEMQAILQKDLRYQQYLENVLDSTDEYPEIVELLLRYETLEATHQDLVERSREGQAVSEDQSALNKRYIKEKVDEILEYNNQIAMLQQRYEAVVSQANKLQAETDRRLQDAAESTLQLGQVLMACDNIYTRCMQTSHVTRKKLLSAEDDKDAAIEKLNQIKDYLGDLMYIVRTYRPEGRVQEAQQQQLDASQPQAMVTARGGASGGVPTVGVSGVSGGTLNTSVNSTAKQGRRSGTARSAITLGVTGASEASGVGGPGAVSASAVLPGTGQVGQMGPSAGSAPPTASIRNTAVTE